MFQTVYMYGNYTKDLESRLTASQFSNTQITNPTPAPIAQSPEFDAKEYIDSVLATFSATTPAPASVSATPPSTVALPSTSYITMGGTSTTTSTNWIDVPGSGIYIDLAHDYSLSAYITFAATLKVAHGNGQAFVRLYDATNNIAVTGSELTTINNATDTQVISSRLNLWSGNNLYKVQIKSLNSFEITYTNGKIKISY